MDKKNYIEVIHKVERNAQWEIVPVEFIVRNGKGDVINKFLMNIAAGDESRYYDSLWDEYCCVEEKKYIFSEMKKVMQRRIITMFRNTKMLPTSVISYPDGHPDASFPKPYVAVTYPDGTDECLMMYGSVDEGEIFLTINGEEAGGWNISHGKICCG